MSHQTFWLKQSLFTEAPIRCGTIIYIRVYWCNKYVVLLYILVQVRYSRNVQIRLLFLLIILYNYVQTIPKFEIFLFAHQKTTFARKRRHFKTYQSLHICYLPWLKSYKDFNFEMYWRQIRCQGVAEKLNVKVRTIFLL